jgi:restriction system protein
MARRKNDDLANAVVDATSLLPWWAGVVLALVAYFWLHSIAQKSLAVAIQPTQISNFAIAALWHGLASVGQYVLPFLLCLGAGISAYKRHQARNLHAEAANRADGIAQGTWREFEVLVGEYFRRQGFTAIDNGGGGPDGGVDVVLQKGSDKYLVQCKQWRALRVGVQPVRELYGVMAARRVAGGFVVTSGEFTEEARNFAAGREIQLINGKTLQRGIRAQATFSGLPVPVSREVGKSAPTAHAAEAVLVCPLCSSPMVLRQTRQGAAAEKQFWGCSRFGQTKCRGTRELGLDDC